jgi:hypothetical protein
MTHLTLRPTQSNRSRFVGEFPGPRRHTLDGLDVLEQDLVALPIVAMPLTPLTNLGDAKQFDWPQLLEAFGAIPGVKTNAEVVPSLIETPLAVARRDLLADKDDMLRSSCGQLDKADRVRTLIAKIDVLEAVHDLKEVCAYDRSRGHCGCAHRMCGLALTKNWKRIKPSQSDMNITSPHDMTCYDMLGHDMMI